MQLTDESLLQVNIKKNFLRLLDHFQSRPCPFNLKNVRGVWEMAGISYLINKCLLNMFKTWKS